MELQQPGSTALIQRAALVLRGLRHFDRLGADYLEKLVRRGTLVELADGEILIREGDTTAAEMYVLIDGVLLVQSRSQLIHRLTQPGEVVGELAVLQAPPRTADVIAESTAHVLAIRPDVVALPEFAELAALFYMMLSHSLANKLRTTATQSRQQIDRVTREAATDALTGLANRKRLDEFLLDLNAASGRNGEPFALVIADVDHFKHYNDANGHLLGDIVLAKVGVILQAHIRGGDLAARYGGEEFVIVLPNCEMANASKLAGEMRSAIEQESFPQAEGQPPGRVTATFGVAVHVGGESVESLLRRADQALYRGKAAGRNRVVAAT